MDRLRKTVIKISATPDSSLHKLPLLNRSLVPLLSSASYLYKIFLFVRHKLYDSGLLQKQRLPVPVISVGNLTWGGNGKTPMGEFIALALAEVGIPPLILTRGYAGGDEAKMLHRHLLQTSARIGVGANRGAVATSVFQRDGCLDSSLMLEKLSSSHRSEPGLHDKKVGIVILDDGMQHWSLYHDVEIIMLNSVMPWGNGQLLPRGSLREPLSAVCRADIAVIHNADLVSDAQLKAIKSTLLKENSSVSIYFTRLAPLCFFDIKNPNSKLPLNLVRDKVVLCVSGIGFPDAFIQEVNKIKPLHVGRIDFSDHYRVQAGDIDVIRGRLEQLRRGSNAKAFIVVTEKDYDRDPTILKQQDDLTILVLCSSIQFIPLGDCTKDCFMMKLKKLLIEKCKLHDR